MHDTKAYQKKSTAISTGLNLTNELNLKHDLIYHDLVNSTNQLDSTSIALQGLVSKALLGDKKYLILDDTQNKQVIGS